MAIFAANWRQSWLARQRNLRTVFRMLLLCRVSVITTAIAGLMLLVPTQALEALQVLLEDLTKDGGLLNPARALALCRLSLTFGSSALLGITAWAFAKVMISARMPQATGPSAPLRPLAVALPRILGVIPTLGLALAMLKLSREFPASRSLFWLALAGALLALAQAFVLYFLFYARLRITAKIRARFGTGSAGRAQRSPSPRTPQGPHAPARSRAVRLLAAESDPAARPVAPRANRSRVLPRLPKLARALLIALTIMAQVLLILFVLTPSLTRLCGPMALVPLALSSWIPLATILALVGSYLRVPLLTIVLVCMLAISALDWNDNHEIRTSPTTTIIHPSLNTAFDQWLDTRPDRAAWTDAPLPYPVFVVATEGGGIRAAYVTAQVLGAIQDASPSFRDHLYMISGVSGGSVGATVFAALLSDAPAKPTPAHFRDAADKILSADLLAPLLAKALYPDIAQQFIPIPIPAFDRARALEDALADAYRDTTGIDTLRRGFYAWHAGTTSTPRLFLNTTNVESGRRFVAAPTLNLPALYDQFTSLAEVMPGREPTLATAACLSARFPIVTPAGYLHVLDDDRGRPGKLRFVDGGYAENSGGATLLDVLRRIVYPDDQPVPRRDVDIHIIVISTFDTYTIDPKAESQSKPPEDRTAFASKGLGELLSPVRTMLNTRSGRGKAAIADLIAFNDVMGKFNPAPVIRMGLVTNDQRIPLGWVLSEASRAEIRRQVTMDDHPPGGDPLPNADGRSLISLLLEPPQPLPPAPSGPN